MLQAASRDAWWRGLQAQELDQVDLRFAHNLYRGMQGAERTAASRLLTGTIMTRVCMQELGITDEPMCLLCWRPTPSSLASLPGRPHAPVDSAGNWTLPHKVPRATECYRDCRAANEPIFMKVKARDWRSHRDAHGEATL
jgi:hypothetical protein